MGTEKGQQEGDGKDTSSADFDEFIQGTTFHGVRFIFDNRATKFRRFLWVIAVLSSVGLFSYQVIDRFTYYFNYDSNVNVKVVYKNEMAFPSVTLCNHNIFRLSKAVEKNLYNILYRKFTGYKTLESEFDGLEKDYREFLMQASHQLKDFVHSCKWSGRTLDPEEVFTRTLTEFGVCYTFNPGNSSQNFTVKGPGSRFGLELMLNLETYEHMPGPHEDKGINILLHDKDETPLVGELGFSIPPASHTLIGVELTQTESLGAPYGDCVAGTIPRSNCQKACDRKDMVNTCGCLMYYIDKADTENNVGFCNTNKSLQCDWRGIAKSKDNKTGCDCQTPCTKASYSPHLSQAKLSLHTVKSMWRGRTEQLDTTRKQYKNALELLHRVDHDIRTSDELNSDRINNLLSQMDEIMTEYLSRLEGDPGEHTPKMDGPYLSEYTFVHTYSILGEKLDQLARKIGRNNQTRSFLMNQLLNHYELNVTAELMSTTVTADTCKKDLNPIACLEEIVEGLEENSYCEVLSTDLCSMDNFPEQLTFDKISSGQAIIESAIADQTKVFQTLIPGNSEALLYHMSNLNATCLEALEAKLQKLLNISDQLEQIKCDYNDAINFTIKLQLYSLLFQTVRDFSKEKNEDFCQIQYTSCSIKLDFEPSMTGEAREEIKNAQPEVKQLQEYLPLAFSSYLASNSTTKEELVKLLYSEDYEFAYTWFIAVMTSLRPDAIDTTIKGYDPLKARIQSISQQYASCYRTDFNMETLESLPIVSYINKYYPNNKAAGESLRHQLATGFSNSSEFFERLLNDIKDYVTSTVGRILEQKQNISNLYNDIRNGMAEFRELDSLIMDVNNYIKLDIFYQDLSYTKVTQQAAFSFISLLSEIGGFLGLLLGASVLTVCELVDYLTDIFISMTKKGNGSNRIRVKPLH